MSEARWSIPPAWAWTSVETIATVVGGGTPPANDPANFDPEGIPWITPADLTGFEGIHIERGARSLSTSGYSRCGAKMLPAGTVLLSSRAPVGYCAVAANDLCTNQGFKNIVLKGGMYSLYVRHYFRGSIDYLEENASGTTFKELSGGRVSSLSIPVAPVEEQRRIVAKIDSLSAKSKRVRDQLDHIPKLVQKYKQAVLDSCFNVFAYKEPLINFVEKERGIPYGIIQTGIPTTNGVPTVRCGDIRDYSVDKSTLKRVDPVIESQYQRTKLRGGEILIAIRGSVGNTCVASDELLGCNISREVAMIPLRKGEMPQFFAYYLTSTEARSYILGYVKGVAQQGINLADLRGVPAPMVKASVQDKTVRRIEGAFSGIDRLAAEATSARKLIDLLDQAVLAKAFRGELVPQDPADGPASVLLGRIRAERAGAPAAKRRGRPRALT